MEEQSFKDDVIQQVVKWDKSNLSFTLLITKLSLSGWKNLKETVWRFCTKIFDQNLSTQMNWCGRGQKTGLESWPTPE